MKKVHYLTIMLMVLLILAIASGWGLAWKIIVGVFAVYVLIMIGLKFWKNRK